MTLQNRIEELIQCHGTLREVGRLLDIDVGYLSRLWNSKKANPSDAILKKLGLEKSVIYKRIKSRASLGHELTGVGE